MNKVDLHFDICQELNKIYEQKNLLDYRRKEG